MVGAVAAVIVAKEKHIVEAFRSVGATAPAAAVAPGAIGVEERVAFRRLCTRAVLREVGSGAFYLDEPSWEACRAMRRRLALAALAVILLVLIAGVLGWFRAG